MNGTTTFELEPQLDLEMDFSFTPGSPGRLTADPSFSEPAEGPVYEIEEISGVERGQANNTYNLSVLEVVAGDITHVN